MNLFGWILPFFIMWRGKKKPDCPFQAARRSFSNKRPVAFRPHLAMGLAFYLDIAKNCLNLKLSIGFWLSRGCHAKNRFLLLPSLLPG